ncbi:J domain-containing protein [Amnibacterium soli]
MTARGPAMPRPEAAALLGVPATATPAEVQRAYLRAARTTHPDLLPDSDEAGRRSAAEAFDRLTRARDVLLEPAPPAPPTASAWAPGADGVQYRRVEGRGIGDSLVVLVLLAFLLIGLVSLQQGLGFGVEAPPAGPAATTAP